MKPKLDAHQHFWKYSQSQYPWIPQGSALHRDWLPADLESLQRPLGVAGSIAVQARQSVEESLWLLELARNNPRIAGVVGWVDLRSPRVGEDLARLCADPKFVGVRHVVQDEPDDRFLLGADFVRGLEQLHNFGLRYDLLIFPRQLPAAIQLVERMPMQLFVLDHCAKPRVAQNLLQPWAAELAKLAAFPNVCCKVSGIVTEADHANWSFTQLKPYLEVVEAAFGRNRLMWGSDWPVCLLAASYQKWFDVVSEWVSSWTEEEKSSFFGGACARFYGVPISGRA